MAAGSIGDMVAVLPTFVTMYRTSVSPAKVAALIAVAFSVVGCFPEEQFPPEPKITFKSFVQFTDSASLTISFTDGDGDIGLDPADINPPFDTASPYYYNLFLEYYELQNGQWVKPELLLPYYYRVPRITPTGQNKALQGDIAVALKPWPISSLPFDTVRFSVRLVDRSLKESNEVFTDPVKTTP